MENGYNTGKNTDSKIRMPSFWIPALKEYNTASGTWCVPKKDTDAYVAVKRIMDRMKRDATNQPKEQAAMAMEDRDAPAPPKKTYATLIKAVYDDNDNYHFGILFRIGEDYYVKEVYRTVHIRHGRARQTEKGDWVHYYPTFEASPGYRVYPVTYDGTKIVRKEKGAVKYYPLHGFFEEKVKAITEREDTARRALGVVNKEYDTLRRHYSDVMTTLRQQNEEDPNPMNQMFVDSLDSKTPTEIGLSKEAADELGLDPSRMEEHEKAQAKKSVKEETPEQRQRRETKKALESDRELTKLRKKEADSRALYERLNTERSALLNDGYTRETRAERDKQYAEYTHRIYQLSREMRESRLAAEKREKKIKADSKAQYAT